MNEDQYTAVDILKNPVLIQTLGWNTSQAVGTFLASFNVPAVFVLIPTFQKALLGIFSFIKPTVRLVFRLNSTKFHQGLLNISYDPFVQHELGTVPSSIHNSRKFLSYAAMTCLPHVFLDASKSNEAELEIPFEHVLALLSTNSADAVDVMGRVTVSVFNSLQAATGASPEVELQVFLSCKDIAMHVPIFPHDPLIPSFKQVKTVEAQMFDGVMDIWNNVTSHAKSLTQNAGKIIGGASGIVSALNLDKPTQLDTTATDASMYPIECPSHMDGISKAVRLAPSQVGGYTDHNVFSPSPEEDLDVLKLGSRYSMFQHDLLWTTDDDSGSILAQIPIMPGYCMRTAVDLPNKDGNVTLGTYWRYEHTWLSYITSMFGYWFGNIKYKAQFVSTDFHTGRLGAIFVPDTDNTQSPPSMSEMLQCPHLIMDLKEAKEFEFEIPYQSSMPRKIANTYASDPRSTDIYKYDNRFTLGTLYLVVLNRLVAPNNVANNVNLNLYAAAGDNFEWEYPQLGDMHVCVPHGTVARSVEAQMLDEERKTTTTPPVLSKGQYVQHASARLGTQVRDVRALAKRMAIQSYIMPDAFTGLEGDDTNAGYSLSQLFVVTPNVSSMTIDPATFTNLQSVRFMPSTTVTGDSDPSMGHHWSSYVSRMYAAWHGGMRYMIQPFTNRSDKLTMKVIYDPRGISLRNPATVPDSDYWYGYDIGATLLDSQALLTAQEGTGNATVVTSNCQQAGLTFEIPYVSQYNQLVSESTSVDFRKDSKYLGIFRILTAKGHDDTVAESNPCVVFSGGADDIHFSYPTAPPATYGFRIPRDAY